MRSKKFDDYLRKRLDPSEIKQIEHQVRLEYEALKALQNDVSQFVADCMEEKKIGFNALVKLLDTTPNQLSKIQKGEANLTLASLAHLAALFNKRPHIAFEDYEIKFQTNGN